MKNTYESGGIASFTGVVRDRGTEGKILTMTLEHYPGMTENMLEKIEAEAHSRWNLENCLIIHRYGCLKPGDSIVTVLTASAHRRTAFEACEFLVDWLKTRAPFWKKEENANGTVHWVNTRSADYEAAARWDTEGHKDNCTDR